MLSEQSHHGRPGLHREVVADQFGFAGAPIEGVTYFSQIDPLALAAFGRAWFESGCVSAHFSTMVFKGDEVQASLTRTHQTLAHIAATKPDGSTVLTGTASIGGERPTALEIRRASARVPGELFILDQLSIGQIHTPEFAVRVDMDSPNGDLYPFSLRHKHDVITEFSDWYVTNGNPWGRPILPFEMISVLAHKVGRSFPIRTPPSISSSISRSNLTTVLSSSVRTTE